MTTQGLEAATEKMRSAGVPGVAIDVFSRFHEQVRSQVTGLIPESSRGLPVRSTTSRSGRRWGAP